MSEFRKVLVTGGAGYLGSILTPALLANGYHVTVLDNFTYRQAPLLECCANPAFQVVRGDVCNAERLASMVREVDVIIPLAAIVGAPACAANPTLSNNINLESIRQITAQLRPEQRVVYPTTNSGYGIGEAGKMCTEESPLRPVSLYGRQKVAAEELLLATKQAVSLRLATVFGASPRMRRDLLVNDFTYRAINDRSIVLFEEHFKRNYIHIRDVAQAFLFALRHFDQMRGQAYNVGLSSANLSKRELCETIQKHVPSLYVHAAAVGEDPDKRDYIVSNAKLEALGWSPKFSLDDGIRELLHAYAIVQEDRFTNI